MELLHASSFLFGTFIYTASVSSILESLEHFWRCFENSKPVTNVNDYEFVREDFAPWTTCPWQYKCTRASDLLAKKLQNSCFKDCEGSAPSVKRTQVGLSCLIYLENFIQDKLYKCNYFGLIIQSFNHYLSLNWLFYRLSILWTLRAWSQQSVLDRWPRFDRYYVQINPGYLQYPGFSTRRTVFDQHLQLVRTLVVLGP